MMRGMKVLLKYRWCGKVADLGGVEKQPKIWRIVRSREG